MNVKAVGVVVVTESAITFPLSGKVVLYWIENAALGIFPFYVTPYQILYHFTKM